MLNCISIGGRLTKDPELRTTQSGIAVASFTVACERDRGDRDTRETDFIECVAWRQAGEFISKYFRKGNMILLTGRLQSRKWEDRDGNKRTAWEILVDHAYFGGDKKDDAKPAETKPAETKPVERPTFAEIGEEDGELPF